MTNDLALKAALREAFRLAIKQVGVEVFMSTSLFPLRNQRTSDEKIAA